MLNMAVIVQHHPASEPCVFSQTVLLYSAETWTTTLALERRIDGIYTRLLRKALDVSWQQHITNEEFYGKIPSAMHQLRERRLILLPVTATGVRISR